MGQTHRSSAISADNPLVKMALSLAQNCVPGNFSPSVYGASVLGLEANLVTNYSASAPEAVRFTSPAAELRNATFCNVTVTYTHPGQGDRIVVEAWLPSSLSSSSSSSSAPDGGWNERFLAVGGGGYAAGCIPLSYGAMNGALADGYATVTTDAGLGSSEDPTPWALLSPGNVDLYGLQNLAYVSLYDQAVIGKSLVKSFYGRDPAYSYWTGCSQGGRQGLALAQRYPGLYDGIVAGAPAINWTRLFAHIHWPQQVMNELGAYPYPCEFDAIVKAAVSACDGADGVVDGVISDAGACLDAFDPFSLVGTQMICPQADGADKTISETAAVVVNATWHGVVTADGESIYPGILPGADLTGNLQGLGGIVGTSCDADGCAEAPVILGITWFQLFLAKDANFPLGNMTRERFDALVHLGEQQYQSMLDTADPDLRAFKAAGGKMVSFHGLIDNVIPPTGIAAYYDAVAGVTPGIRDFYRHFEAPGLAHCYGGASGPPTGLFSQLRDWVENGAAPPERTPVRVTVVVVDEEEAATKTTTTTTTTHERVLCAYPQTAALDGGCGDASRAECWSCAGEAWVS
ncbi:putative feruloyl esterase [Colletotrichum tanaceti]|uniref:Carboxylic ester hydrolase n=1 Tax=Colletotrichum tanaceti TaxID=1306861 RepID=A0A4U6X5H5_9PEZI|nr:putative feruloyl esterase [Colletotrichum tanaceti]